MEVGISTLALIMEVTTQETPETVTCALQKTTKGITGTVAVTPGLRDTAGTAAAVRAVVPTTNTAAVT